MRRTSQLRTVLVMLMNSSNKIWYVGTVVSITSGDVAQVIEENFCRVSLLEFVLRDGLKSTAVAVGCLPATFPFTLVLVKQPNPANCWANNIKKFHSV